MNSYVFKNDLFQRWVQSGSKKPFPQQQQQHKQNPPSQQQIHYQKNPTNKPENLPKKLQQNTSFKFSSDLEVVAVLKYLGKDR